MTQIGRVFADFVMVDAAIDEFELLTALDRGPKTEDRWKFEFELFL